MRNIRQNLFFAFIYGALVSARRRCAVPRLRILLSRSLPAPR
jgi:hypothetical protein